MTSASQLVQLGFHKADNGTTWFKRAVEDFQRGWANEKHVTNGEPLVIDGIDGPKTRAALTVAIVRKGQGLGTASEHFSYHEFACHCGGKYADCRVIMVHRPLLTSLEAYRAKVGHGVAIVSGYRCVRHNADVGGKTGSQHLWGAAADLKDALHVTVVKGLRRFSGLGIRRTNSHVVHADVRHASGHNTTGGTPDRPTVWTYAN